MLSNNNYKTYHKTRISVQRVWFFFVSGCPAIVVGVSAALANEGYGNQRL